MKPLFILLGVLVCVPAALATDPVTKTSCPPPRGALITQASWYDCCNAHTADGTRFNANNPHIAATVDFPFGTELIVTNLRNCKKVRTVSHDLGPSEAMVRKGRRIDLTRAAAQDLRFLTEGTAQVSIVVASK